MSYRNPKAAPINTGAAVYQGIQKLAGDVYTFATEERVRKGQLIGESIAAQQAIDDDINKMGLTLEEGENNFENQIFAEAQAAKQKIAAQYDIMSKTFSSPEQRAKAKAEINKLNKYPEGLTADLATGKYLVDQFRKGLSIEPGKTGSISATNDLNTLEVIKDMQGGGKNTKIETNAAGARTLVTTVGDKTYKLNISNITNGLKTNPNQMIFNTVSDDSGITNTYLSQMGLSGKNLDLPALVNTGILKKESIVTAAGVDSEIYTVDRDKAYAAVSGLSEKLITEPSNYTYTNSIWQDKLGNSITLKQALATEGKDKVLKQIREYYVEEAIGSSIANGISAQLPKPEKSDKYESDKDLRTLAKNAEGKELTIGGIRYKIQTFGKGKDEKQYILKGDKPSEKLGEGSIIQFEYDEKNRIPLRNKNNKLNYEFFRSLTGSTGKRQ